MKAVALFSGGLDSILAIKLIQEQGIEVIPLHFYTWFTGRKDSSFVKECKYNYGITPQIVNISEKFFSLLLKPKYGYGQGMNPCIDCKILFFKEAKRIMEETEASFVISGEVVGQRPFSQRRETIRLIERESNLEGLIVRPLSAKLLPPTIPEKEGWIDRKRLEAIGGRGRKRQLELAKKFKLKHIPSPAGGCILTDPTFSNRLRALLEVVKEPDLETVKLLRMGRVFRLNNCLVVLARNEMEKRAIEKHRSAWKDITGKSCALVLGNSKGMEKEIVGILLRYSGKDKGEISTPEGIVKGKALAPDKVHEYLIRG